MIPTPGDASAVAISADGLTVVGATDGQAFRWSESLGIELLGLGTDGIASTARAVSADGSVVVGSYTDNNNLEQPFRWTSATGMTSIAGPSPAGSGGTARDVSDDGTIVVGEFGVRPTGENCNSPPFSPCTLVDPGSVRAFSWNATSGMEFLEFAATGTPEESIAVSISGDGSVITGTQSESGTICSPVSIPATGNGINTCTSASDGVLQVFQNTNSISSTVSLVTAGSISAVSSDGSTIIGRTFERTPFRWREDTGVMELGESGIANASNATGNIVGGSFGLWIDGTIAPISNLLINGYGLRSHGISFGTVDGISDDGLTITGTAFIPSTATADSTQSRAYLARIDSTPLSSAATSLPPLIPLSPLSAALPLARSTQVNETVAAFVTLINRTDQQMQGCAITFNADLPATLSYSPTNPTDNSISGPADELFDLNPSETKTFVVSMTPSADFLSQRLDTVYECGNAPRTRSVRELNSLVLASSVTPVPDILALSATTTNDGIAGLDSNNQTAFSVASLNLGAASSSILVEAIPTLGLAAFTTSICETDPATGECIGATVAGLNVSFGALQERTFAVFVTSNQPIGPLYDIRRVRVQFTDSSGELRGSTSVAVVTPQLEN